MDYSEKSKHLMHLYENLLRFYGPQHWWPAKTRWEVCVGAILTQNTNWGNVEKAILNLKNAGFLMREGEQSELQSEKSQKYPEKLLLSTHDEIASLIRPSGYFNIKAKRLHSIAEWWLNNTKNGALNQYSNDPIQLRDSLLQVNGVGPETADTITLYAFNLPIFVIDTYTKRVSSIYLKTPIDIKYDDLQFIFMRNLNPDPELFNEFHALIVKLAKEKDWQAILREMI